MYALISNQTPEKDEELAVNLYQKLAACARILRSRSAAGPFFLGKQLSVADIAIVPFLDRFEVTMPFYRGFELLPVAELPELVPLQQLLHACRERPAFNRASQSREFYIGAYRSYAARRGASRPMGRAVAAYAAAAAGHRAAGRPRL